MFSRSSLRATTALTVVGMIVGCASPDSESRVDSIVNGEISVDDNAVVALTVGGATVCSGTLVTPQIVLTAAHCLPPHQSFPVDSLEIFFGTDVLSETGRNQGVSVDVAFAIANPLWTSETVANDIGVVVLAEPSLVKPIPMLAQPLEMVVPSIDEARVVGFGITEAMGDGAGLRRSGVMDVTSLDPSTIHLSPGPSATCNGDSGGALLITIGGEEFLAGVHSRSNCEDVSLSERVDVHARSFVLEIAAEQGSAAACNSDGLCAAGCASPDPDCLCGDDGMCTDECSQPQTDPDCAESDDIEYNNGLAGGCTASGNASNKSPQGSTTILPILSLLLLGAFASRRRRKVLDRL